MLIHPSCFIMCKGINNHNTFFSEKIRTTGSDAPDPIKSFTDLSNPPYSIPVFLQKTIAASEFQEPTPIQKQAIPALLAKRDVICCAPTGSGKTLAYVAPILAMLNKPMKETFRALVLAPTKELAHQIYRFDQFFYHYLSICYFSIL